MLTPEQYGRTEDPMERGALLAALRGTEITDFAQQYTAYLNSLMDEPLVSERDVISQMYVCLIVWRGRVAAVDEGSASRAQV